MVHNYYLYEEDGQLSILPWDYNLSFGGFSSGSGATSIVNSPIDSPVSGGNTSDRPLVAWIFDDEDSLNAYHEAYASFIADTIESGWLASEITRVSEMIRSYLESDPTAFYTVDEFDKGIETLQAFVAKRSESILGQLNGTIPSTTAGQTEDSSALIDASDITISDMGSMDNGNGGPGGEGGPPSFGSMPAFPGTTAGTPDSNASGASDAVNAGADTPDEQTAPANETAPAAAAESTENADDASASRPAADNADPSPEAQPAADNANSESSAENGQHLGHMGGMPGPGGMGGPGFMPDDFGAESGNNTTGFIYYGIFAALLVLAVIVIARTKSHNG
ncbi:MAG: CotH kinase family protein, partial [Clostridia bacterium]|nr:CotH kinase family protein [Clostridia bacterium]